MEGMLQVEANVQVGILYIKLRRCVDVGRYPKNERKDLYWETR